MFSKAKKPNLKVWVKNSLEKKKRKNRKKNFLLPVKLLTLESDCINGMTLEPFLKPSSALLVLLIFLSLIVTRIDQGSRIEPMSKRMERGKGKRMTVCFLIKNSRLEKRYIGSNFFLVLIIR